MEWRQRERHDYGMRIAHAKDANPPTLLTSPTQEELRRAPEAGPDAGRGADAGRKGMIFNFECLMFDYRIVRMWKSVKVFLKFEA